VRFQEAGMPHRAVLFDFDGTLADSFDAIIASVNFVRQSFGLEALPDGVIRKYIGHGLLQLIHDLVPGATFEDAIARYREHHARTMEAGTRLFPEVLPTLIELTRRGYKLAVCSNKAVGFTRQLVKMLHVDGMFAEVLGPEDVDNRPKPDPAMLLEGCRRLGVSPTDAVYIGDMTVDVLAGNAAGIPVWLVHVGLVGDGIAKAPAKTLGTFAEMLEYLPG
jgi:2-phosphoglycolate phosphatase